MDDIATSFIAHVPAEGRTLDVVIGLSDVEQEVWGYHESVPWMKLSGYITKSTVTQNRTAAGELVVINWGSLAFVTYENPWKGIASADAVKKPKG